MADPTAELLVKIGADTKALKTGLASAEKQVGGFSGAIRKHHRAIGMAMTAVGAAILATAALSVKQFAKMGDEVQKMALRTGFSTEALSELRHAAQLSGASLAGLEKASRTLSGAILDAGYGLETYVRTFDQLGLSYEDLAKLSPEKQFLRVMEALADVSNESARAAIATDLFGRAGTQLLPMLVDGAKGLAAMRQEAHDLGIVFDQEAANKAAAFQDAITKLKGSFSGIMITVGEFLADALKPLIDMVTSAVKRFGDWSKENPALARVITYTTLAIGGLLAVLGPLLIILPSLTAGYAALSGFMLKTFIPAIWATVTALWAKVTALLAAMAATGVLIPAAIAAVAAIALLATGITLLVKNQKEQYQSTNAVTEATNELTEATGGLTESTEQLTEITSAYGFEAWNAQRLATEGLDNTAESAVRLREETLKLKGATEELTGSLKETVATAYLAYVQTGWGRALTPFEKEQRKRLGELIGIPYTPVPVGYMPEPFRHGGIVTKPTVGLIGEAGPEAVVPLDRMGGITINFTEPIFMEREESMNKLADKIYGVIKKDQRLSFGGAYSG